MQQEVYSSESAPTNDMSEYDDETDYDDEEEEEEADSQTFGLDDIGEPCGNCRRRTLIEKVLDGFLVLYCTHCKMFVCPVCKYPELKPYEANGESGLHCTQLPDTGNPNCGKYFIRSKKKK